MKHTLAIAGVVFGIFAVITTALLLYCIGVTAGVRLDPRKLTLDTTCIRIYDANGEAVESASVRADAPLDALPDCVKHAFIAVEDKRFYEHRGIDLKRIAAAAWHNLTSFSFREGASTISQQLIKNTHLSNEKTIARKLQECKLARALEKRYSKDEILCLYLNSIYFGHHAFGIADAARFYFGKNAEALTPAEGAMLAAIVRSPNRYSPFLDPEKCRKRRDLVLSLMKAQGYLAQEAYEDAVRTPLPAQPGEKGGGNAYLARVIDELCAILPDAKSGDWGSLRIYTRYDPLLQEKLEKTETESDLCIVVRENETNCLKALHATAGILKRLPASTIKPLLVYAPALEENMISPATPVLDEKTDFGGYSPDDYRGASGTYVSARYALAHSVNIPAVRILNETGIERAVRYLEKMDLPVAAEDKTLALALGGMREGFTLPALADAYATFANEGYFSSSGTITRIKDEKGTVLYERNASARKVFSDDVSYLINDMLQTAAKEGTAKTLRTLPFPVCGKTGTAECGSGNSDAYCIGYTKEDVVAVWMGNADHTPVKATGGGLPANIARNTLAFLYSEKAPKEFSPCKNVVRLHYDREAYERDHAILLSDPCAPPYSDPAELFRSCARPQTAGTRFSHPTISMPQISVKNGTVYIVLCQTKYYDYEIKRINRGKTATIYSGPYQKTICDNSVRAGENYVYTVMPKYNATCGDPVTLPEVRIPASNSIPERWWD